MRTDNIYEDILKELRRQDLKWGEQNHSPIEWLVILGEEFGEVCKEALDNKVKYESSGSGLENYREEVVQVAAVAIQMLRCLDRHAK